MDALQVVYPEIVDKIQIERYPKRSKAEKAALPMIAPPKYDNLISDISDALALHYRKWVSDRVGQEIYAYIIYATALVSDIGISVLTEQGLKQVALEYKTKSKYGYGKTLEYLVNDLRWSVEDTPYCIEIEYDEIFTSINERLNAMMPYVHSLHFDDPAFSEHNDMMDSILVSALNKFRQETLGGAKRPVLYVDFGDMSDEERLMFVKQCNDPEAIEWYCSSIAMAR